MLPRPSAGRVGRQEASSETVVKQPHIVNIGAARRVPPRVVRHLCFGRQTRDHGSRNASGRRKRFGRVTERLAVRTQQMTVSPLIEARRVDVYLLAPVVR